MPETIPQEPAVPIAAQERIEVIDILRGFALLGILVMNITGMAFPFAAYFNPKVYGGGTGIDFAAWVFAHLFYDAKMMSLFSMLFGAGVLLMWERAEAAGRGFASFWYRRTFVLLLFGMVHAYLIWHGDILVTYALCGLLLFLFRRRSARALMRWSLVFLVLGALLSAGGGYAQSQLRNVVQEIEAKVAAGEEMTPRRQGLVDQWNDLRHDFAPTPEEMDEQIATMSGDAAGVLRMNAEEALGMQVAAIPFILFWRGMALMLLGMALYKLGVLTGQRSSDFYRRCMIFGFGIGLPLIVVGLVSMQRTGFDFVTNWAWAGQFNWFGSVLVALGYVGLVHHLHRRGAFPGLQKRLGAVGRMALSNYLGQSVLGVAIFYGTGLGLFGQISRFHLWWFILGIWAVQLLLSPWWLQRFRFGPMEWLWRSLTYGRWQPMKRS